MPDRKVLAGGTSAILAWLFLRTIEQYGYALPSVWQEITPALVGYFISYVVPPSVRDVIKRIDGTIVEIVAKDPKIPLVKPDRL